MKIRKTAITVSLALCCCSGCGSPVGSAAEPAQPEPLAQVSHLRQSAAQHPEMGTQLLHHLRSKYPGLESRFLKAVASLEGKYPGLAYSLPRHLIEDLQGEPMQALLDIVDAERQRYPNFGSQLRELRRAQGPARASLDYLASHYPGLRSQMLARPVDVPLPEQIRYDVQSVIHEQFPQLKRQILLSASREADENAPGLASQVAQQRGQEGPLRWLVNHRPEFVRAAVGRIAKENGQQIRQAAVAVLSKLEQDPQCRLAPRMTAALDFINASYPNLLAELVDQRMAARQRMRQAIASQFPEAGSIALQTLLTKHPQLPSKALASLSAHYPNLPADFLQAVETELPGVRQETRQYLQANYPDVAAQLPPL